MKKKEYIHTLEEKVVRRVGGLVDGRAVLGEGVDGWWMGWVVGGLVVGRAVGGGGAKKEANIQTVEKRKNQGVGGWSNC
jgi:hypothetical protein